MECEIIESMANFKVFQYCRTHKEEVKGICPGSIKLEEPEPFGWPVTFPSSGKLAKRGRCAAVWQDWMAKMAAEQRIGDYRE